MFCLNVFTAIRGAASGVVASLEYLAQAHAAKVTGWVVTLGDAQRHAFTVNAADVLFVAVAMQNVRHPQFRALGCALDALEGQRRTDAKRALRVMTTNPEEWLSDCSLRVVADIRRNRGGHAGIAKAWKETNADRGHGAVCVVNAIGGDVASLPDAVRWVSENVIQTPHGSAERKAWGAFRTTLKASGYRLTF